jgi:hypothetical protein
LAKSPKYLSFKVRYKGGRDKSKVNFVGNKYSVGDKIEIFITWKYSFNLGRVQRHASGGLPFSGRKL